MTLPHVSLPDPPLLVITDRRLVRRPLVDLAAEVFAAGCRWVMVREKDLSGEALAELTAEIVAAARPYGATVSVNGDAEAARRAGASGVHLPQGVEPSAASGLVGVSAHSVEEVGAAAAAGAGYVTFSPVFASISKQGYGPEDAAGLMRLRHVCASAAIPVIALGGVVAENAAACLAAGAAGVAVLGAVMQAADPGTATAALISAMRAGTVR